MSSPTSLSSIRSDAIARRDRGDLHGARSLLERALEAATMSVGDDHPEVLTTAHLLASLHRQSGDLSGARRVLENALYAGSNRHGDDHPLLLAISFELGEIADELGNRHEARRHYTRVARFGPASPGFNQQQVQAARAWLGPGAPAAAGTGSQPVTVPAPEPLGVPATPPPQAEPPPSQAPVQWPPTPFTPVDPTPPAQPVPATQPTPPVQPVSPAPVAPPTPQAPPHQGSPQAPPPPPGVPAFTQTGAAPPATAQPQYPSTWPPAQGGQVAPVQPAAGTPGYHPHRTMPPLGPQPPQLADPAYGPMPPQVPRQRGRGALIGSLVAAAVAAIAAGVTVAVLLNQSPDDPVQPPDDTTGVATDLTITINDSRVRLGWTDPSNGDAQPIIIGARESEGWRQFAVPAKGTTETVISGLNKKYDYCFRVLLAYSVDNVKQSEQVCTDREKAHPSPSS